MKCFMCGHDKFKVQWESTNSLLLERDWTEKPQIRTISNDMSTVSPIYIWCQQCHSLIWDFSNGWASGDMANIWQWNGYTLVLKNKVSEADLTREIQKLGKDKLKLILEALQKETQNA